MELVAARGADRHIFARMPDNYLAELAAHRERDVGATDSRNYPYLDAYFSERGRSIRHSSRRGCCGLLIHSRAGIDRSRLGSR
jgi:hypothetical protein